MTFTDDRDYSYGDATFMFGDFQNEIIWAACDVLGISKRGIERNFAQGFVDGIKKNNDLLKLARELDHNLPGYKRFIYRLYERAQKSPALYDAIKEEAGER